MEEGKFEKTYWIGIVINSILTILCVISGVYILLKAPNTVAFYIFVLETLLAFYYVVAGYKKPHGNLLRYIIWGYVVFTVFQLNGVIILKQQDLAILEIVIIAMSAYFSGRLNKFRQNQILGLILFIVVLTENILYTIRYPQFPLISKVFFFIPAVLFIDILFAYTLRYHMHKEAAFEA